MLLTNNISRLDAKYFCADIRLGIESINYFFFFMGTREKLAAARGAVGVGVGWKSEEGMGKRRWRRRRASERRSSKLFQAISDPAQNKKQLWEREREHQRIPIRTRWDAASATWSIRTTIYLCETPNTRFCGVTAPRSLSRRISRRPHDSAEQASVFRAELAKNVAFGEVTDTIKAPRNSAMPESLSMRIETNSEFIVKSCWDPTRHKDKGLNQFQIARFL